MLAAPGEQLKASNRAFLEQYWHQARAGTLAPRWVRGLEGPCGRVAFGGERRGSATYRLFFPSGFCTTGEAGGTSKLSPRTTKMRVDLLMSFKVTWDRFASLDIIQSSRRCPGEGGPDGPGRTSRPAAPQLSLRPRALPAGTSRSFFLMFFPFGLWGVLSSVKDKGAARLSPAYVREKPALPKRLWRAVGCRRRGGSPQPCLLGGETVVLWS